MGGINLGAFFQGAVEGYDKGIARQRDQERYEREQKQWAEEDRHTAAKKKFSEDMAALNKSVNEGSGDFAAYLRPDIVEAQKNGLPSPATDPAVRSKNPLMNMGEGLYANQSAVYDMHNLKMQNIQSEYLSVVDPIKIPAAMQALKDQRKAHLTERRNEGLALLMTGNQKGLEALNVVYSLYPDGRSIDTKSGTFDPKTQSWTGINVLDSKGSVVETRNVTPKDMVAMAFMTEPGNFLEYQIKANTLQLAQNKDIRETEMLPFDKRESAAKAFNYNAAANSYGTKAQINEQNRESNIAAFVAKQFPQIAIEKGMPPVQLAEADAHNRKQANNQAMWRNIYDTGITNSGKGISMEAAFAATRGQVETHAKYPGKGFVNIPSVGLVMFDYVK